MKQLLRFKTFLILALLAMVGNSAWAQDESVTFSSQGYTNAQEISSYSGTNFSVTFAKGTNSNNAPKYYNTGAAIRCYGGNTITVSSSTKTIASVQLSFGSSDGSNAITASVGDYSQGEWTGSANSVTFTIGGSSGNRRIAGISVTYEAGGTTPSKADPELAWSASSASAIVGEAFTAPTLTNPNNVAVTYESTNENVATISANGEVSVVAAGETTIKAVFAGDDTYNAQTVSYTLTVAYTSLKDLQENVTSTSQDFTLQMTDIYVTAVKNKNAYISDGTYGALIYTDGHGLEAGQKLNGTLSAKYVLYHGQTEITNFSTSGLTITSEALPAQTKAIGDLSGANQSLLVTLENVTYDGTVLTDGTNSITPYTTFMSDLGLESGKTYNVTGIVILYNTTLEIAPRKAEDIVEVGAPVVASITIDPATYTMDAKAGGGEIPVVSENLASDPQLAVVFVEADGVTPATYDWISATINADGNIDGAIQANTGDARTAYFYVTGKDANGNTVQSNLVTFTQEAPVAATPTIVFNPESIDFDANSGYRTIGGDYFQLKDFDSTPSLEILYYKSDGDTEKQGGYDWLTADFNSNNQIDFTWGTNTGAARSAYLKIHAVGTTVYSNLFTVNQAAAATPDVAHYYQKVSSSADLTNGDYLIVCEEGNVAFNGGLETLDAASNTIEVIIADNKIASSETVDAAVFTIDTTAGTLLSASGLYIGQTTDGNGMKSSAETPYKNTLQVDTDGNADIASAGAYLRYNAASNQERFRYYKSSSYTGQKVIQLYKRMDGEMPAASPALAVTPDVVTVPYTGGAESFTVTPSNVENAFGGDVTFYDPTDTETTVDQPNWIGISYDYSDMSLSYTITDENNTGAERTACFKYFIKCDNGVAMSNLVTVKQEAYVAPVASIAVDPIVVNATSVATEGTIAVTYSNFTAANPGIELFEADGTTSATYDWLTASFDDDATIVYTIQENTTTEARTAYFKAYAMNGETKVYSDLVTVAQEGVVVDYATLPFTFDGGRADIEGTNGFTHENLGSDYSSTPKLKFDTTGDALVLKFNERPGKLTFDIKGNSFSGGTFTVQTSEDGVNYTDLKTYTELGATQSEKFNTLGENVRYIKWVYTEKSAGNVALGNIALEKYTDTPVVVVAAPTFNPAGGEVAAGTEVTLSAPEASMIVYTTDGTDPSYVNSNGEVYTTPIVVNADMTIKAIAVDDNENESEVVSATYTVAAEEVEGVKYYKVASTDQLEEGVDYLLVYEGVAGEGAAAYGGLDKYTTNSYGKSVDLKHIGGSVVTITDEAVVPVTLKSRSEDGTKWAMRDANGWIAAVDGNNLHGDKTEDDAVWTFDFTAEAHKQIYHEFSGNTDTRYLEYNTNNPRFAGYTGTQSAVYLYKAASYNVSVGATGYATLYYGTKNLVVPENVEAYTYTVNNGKLEESYLYSTNEVIPAGTGVVLKAPAGEYKFAVTTEAGLEDTDNLLFGFDEPSTTVAPAAGDYLFYILGVDNGKVGFYWGKADGAAFTSGAHKAYLAVPTEQASGLRGFSFDGSVVGINTIGVDMPEGNAYDLQGRRVQQLQKNGLYIVDGKKMLAK